MTPSEYRIIKSSKNTFDVVFYFEESISATPVLVASFPSLTEAIKAYHEIDSPQSARFERVKNEMFEHLMLILKNLNPPTDPEI